MVLDQAERDRLIEQYAQGPAKLKAAFSKLPPEARQWRPGPGKWSAHEIVCHCADSEMNAALRIRYLVAENEPLIVGYDQDAWARALDYHRQPLEPALAAVEAARASTTALIRSLSDEAWQKRGRHTESGDYDAEHWLRSYAEHLEKHTRQVERNLAEWQAERRTSAAP